MVVYALPRADFLVQILTENMVASPKGATLRIAFRCNPQEGADQLQEVFNYFIKGRDYQFITPPGLPIHHPRGTTNSSPISEESQAITHSVNGEVAGPDRGPAFR